MSIPMVTMFLRPLPNLGSTLRRSLSIGHERMAPGVAVPSLMSAWQIYQHGGVDKLTLSNTVRVPEIRRPGDVLVEVHAASVNPIDLLMLSGYGSKILNALRRVSGTLHNGSEFPLTLGRDFSGVIVDAGQAVDRKKFHVGDEVWGAGNAAFPGTFAQYITVSADEISHKPKSLSHVEAGSLPYVAATSWAAIKTVGQFDDKKARRKRVLITGASGGIGTFSVQLLKAWGADVTATCSADAAEKILQLGANTTIDYKQYDIWAELERVPKFDLIFETVDGNTATKSVRILKSGGTFVTLITPVMRNLEERGFVAGAAKTAVQAAQLSCKGLANRVHLRWALFKPSGEAMRVVSQLVDNGKIVPVVEKVFPFAELPKAFEKVAAKHNRGKTVVDMKAGATASKI